jgi:hypothetical protein
MSQHENEARELLRQIETTEAPSKPPVESDSFVPIGPRGG